MNFSEWFGKNGIVSRYWNSPWVGIPLWIAFAYLCVWRWYFSIPTAGKAIGALAVVAGIMSIREMMVLGKLSWVFLLICMLITEFKAIDNDHRDAQIAEDAHLAEERSSFKEVIRQQDQDFRGLLQADQDNFQKTLAALINTDKTSRAQFSRLMSRDNELFVHEEKLAESTSGILVPGAAPTPENDCIRRNPDGFAVLYGDNTAVIKNFPHYIIGSSEGPLITLNKSSNGNISIIMDVRDATGKIVARLGDEGYLIGSRLAISRPNKSTLVVLDEYGNKALDINYLNTQAISVNGYVNYKGAIYSIQLPNIHLSCSHGGLPGSSDIVIK